jgi:hypothetical protein
MHVRLKNTWFAGPAYGRFKPAARRLDTVEIPDELRDKLPSSAEIMESPIKRVVGEEPVITEFDTDPEALEATADAIADAEKAADEQRERNQAKIKERLEAELAQAAAVEAAEQARLDAEEVEALPETNDETLPEADPDFIDPEDADFSEDESGEDEDETEEAARLRCRRFQHRPRLGSSMRASFSGMISAVAKSWKRTTGASPARRAASWWITLTTPTRGCGRTATTYRMMCWLFVGS